MPRKLERKLIASAHRRGLYKSNPATRRRFGAYVYGNRVMQKHRRQQKRQGRRK